MPTCSWCGAKVEPPPGGSSRSFGDWWEPENERPLCEGAEAED